MGINCGRYATGLSSRISNDGRGDLFSHCTVICLFPAETIESLPGKKQPYECGVDPVGEASTGQFKIHFFIVAILFIVFEVETLYLLPWAVVLQRIGMFGYIEMFVFIFLLLVGFIYAWAKGALEWEGYTPGFFDPVRQPVVICG